MTPVCGAVGIDGRPFAAGDLAGVMEALRPLGPDAARTWAGHAGRTGVALGARDAAQPVHSADGALCLVADAELDCRADLTAHLAAPPAATDPELILAAYERWGERCIERLSGAFAFALADARRGGVLIARDQLGLRPLAIHRRRGVVAFATTSLSLSALDGVGHELDRVAVAERLALEDGTERSFVAGVAMLPAATCAWIDDHGLRRRRYWGIDPDRFVELDSPQAYAAELRAALESAVERRMPADGRAGVLLSGGLDSTSVAATAALLRPGDVIRTYTSAPPPGWSGPTAPNTDADESPLVRELAARHPNLRPTFVGGGDEPLLASHDARFAAGSPPALNPCNELWVSEAQRCAAADGLTSLLTGMRGNTFFSADDPYWLAALLARGRVRDVRRELAVLPSPRVAARELARQLLPASVHRVRGAAWARRAGLSGEAELRFAGRETAAIVRDRSRALGPPPRRSWRARALTGTAWSGLAAEAATVRDTLAGVRTTDPTTDVRVIAVCATQPPWARRREGRSRAVARDAMADRLPPSIAERTRRGAQLPDWLDHLTRRRGELVEELEHAREHASCRELLDLDRIGAALDDWPDPARLRTQFARTTQIYRHDLPRALLMCRYVRFFEAHGRRRA